MRRLLLLFVLHFFALGCAADVDSLAVPKASEGDCNFDELVALLGPQAELQVERADANAEKLALKLTSNAFREHDLVRAAEADYQRALADAPSLEAALASVADDPTTSLFERATLDNWHLDDALTVWLVDRLAEPHEVETSLAQLRCLTAFLGGTMSEHEYEESRDHDHVHARLITFDHLYDTNVLRELFRVHSARTFRNETVDASVLTHRSHAEFSRATFNACHEAGEVRYMVHIVDCESEDGCTREAFAFLRSETPGQVEFGRIDGAPAVYQGPSYNPNLPISETNKRLPRWASYYRLCPNSRH